LKSISSKMEHRDLIIIGAGPAGLSAGIYAVRNGLKTLILERGNSGGLAQEAPWVENYPGFEGIEGMKLMDQFKTHALRYVEIHELESVEKIEKCEGFTVSTNRDKYKTTALIFAMGTTLEKIGVKGEEKFSGKGVSYCATCDGFFFKGKRVVVVGGGNSAVINAIYLDSIGCKVTLIHRRNQLRADELLQKTLFDRGIKVIWNSTIEEILGDKLVSSVKIRNRVENKIQELKVEGVFVSIGEKPNSQLAKSIGVKLDEDGYIITDKSQRTNVPKVYGAGDITGGLKQIITASAEGAIAATSAYEDIKNPYWVDNKKLLRRDSSERDGKDYL